MIDLEAIKKKLEKLQSGYKNSSKVELWKPKVGKYRVRLMPWPDAKPGEPFKELWFYYNPYTILAPHQFGKKDPIHDLVSNLYNSGKKEDKELAKELKAKMRTFAPLIIKEVNGEKIEDDTVYAWGFSKTVYQRLLTFFLDDDVDNFLDLHEGIDLIVSINKIEGKIYNETVIDLARKSTPLADSDDQIKKLVDAIPDLMDAYPLKPPEEIEKLLNTWLQGESDQPADNGSTGESRGPAKVADALDDLVNDISSKKIETSDDLDDESSKQVKVSASKKTKKSKSPDEDLDSAFEDLIAGE